MATETPNELLLQPNSPTTPKKTRNSSPHSKEVKRLLTIAASNYPNMEQLGQTIATWQQLWEDCAQEFGMAILTMAVKRCLSTHKFFPVPAEIRATCVEVKAAGERQAAAGKEKFKACGREVRGGPTRGGAQCVGGLWIVMEVQWSTDAEGNPAKLYDGVPQRVAYDCQCMIQWRKDHPKPEVA